MFRDLSLKTHDVLPCLGNLFIISALQNNRSKCTGGSKYWFAAASGLGSGQSDDLELSMHWNCGWRAVSKGQGRYDWAVT